MACGLGAGDIREACRWLRVTKSPEQAQRNKAEHDSKQLAPAPPQSGWAHLFWPLQHLGPSRCSQVRVNGLGRQLPTWAFPLGYVPWLAFRGREWNKKMVSLGLPCPLLLSLHVICGRKKSMSSAGHGSHGPRSALPGILPLCAPLTLIGWICVTNSGNDGG